MTQKNSVCQPSDIYFSLPSVGLKLCEAHPRISVAKLSILTTDLSFVESFRKFFTFPREKGAADIMAP